MRSSLTVVTANKEATEPRFRSFQVEMITSKVLRSTPWLLNRYGTSCHKWPLISFITGNRIISKSHAIGTNGGPGTPYHSGAYEFTPMYFNVVRVALYLVVCAL